MMINVAKNIHQYSPQELRDYGYRGQLECNGFDLSDFVERIFTDYDGETDQDEIVAALDEGYDKGYSDAKAECIAALENL